MKSMLHEASTVTKAIEKAWVDSGRPYEFTITIHETGERNFLGFTKRPAIVSITYDPRRQPAKVPSATSFKDAQGRNKPVFKGKQDSRFDTRPKREFEQQQPKQRFVARDMAKDKGVFPAQQNQSQQSQQQGQPQPQQQQQQLDQWSQEMINDVQGWLKELAQIIAIDTAWTCRADRRMLTILFDRPVTATADDEHLLFSGFSYVLMQFLKKKHKKKFRGYHLVINAKKNAANESV